MATPLLDLVSLELKVRSDTAAGPCGPGPSRCPRGDPQAPEPCCLHQEPALRVGPSGLRAPWANLLSQGGQCSHQRRWGHEALVWGVLTGVAMGVQDVSRGGGGPTHGSTPSVCCGLVPAAFSRKQWGAFRWVSGSGTEGALDSRPLGACVHRLALGRLPELSRSSHLGPIMQTWRGRWLGPQDIPGTGALSCPWSSSAAPQPCGLQAGVPTAPFSQVTHFSFSLE